MQLNRIIGGRYRIVAALGEGGMANVYRAYDTILERDVALKLMRLDMRDDQSIRKRFENEIAATSALVHPNIIQVYDYGEEDGSQYLVSEFIDGMDLKRYIIEKQPLPVTRVIDIMRDILAGVAEAHKAGMVHRDLKPQNILINDQHQAKITDFGIARTQKSFGMTKTNTTIGSVHYMSPEQVKGEVATIQSDIYSLGIMLYEMLAGHVPFDGETAVAVAVKHTQEAMPAIRAIDPRIPQALENVIFKATAKNPLNRYVSANDMRQDLATVLSAHRIDEAPWQEPVVTHDDTVTKVMSLTPVKEALASTKTMPIPPLTATTPQNVSETAQKSPVNKAGRRTWGIILIAAIVAFLVGIAVMALNRPVQKAVPNVTGMSQANAMKQLSRDDLKLGNIVTTSSTKYRAGEVVRTSPSIGKTVQVGAQVDLIVSKGPAKVRFGDYVNEKYTTIAEKLKLKGYAVEQKQVASDSVPAGYIVSQTLDAEDRVVPAKTTVKFAVSTGPEKYTVPDFSAQTQSDVAAWATERGIAVNYNAVYSDSVEVGEIVSQSVTPGAMMTANDALVITVSKGVDPAVQSSREESIASSLSASYDRALASQTKKNNEKKNSSEKNATSASSSKTSSQTTTSSAASKN